MRLIFCYWKSLFAWYMPVLYGSDSAPPPDYTPLANASAESAQVMKDLGQQQIDLAKQQYADNKPVLDKIAQQQIDIGNQNQEAGQLSLDLQKTKYIPLQKSIVDEVNNFDTDAYREGLASKAAADYGTATTNGQASLARQMASMGVNPNSGKFAAVSNQNALDTAAGKANAMTTSRQQAQATGMAQKMAAAGLGTGNSGAAQGAYSLALNAGNSAANNTQSAGNNLLQGVSSGANTIGSGRQMLQSGLGGILNSQSNLYGQSMNNQSEMMGSILGGATKLGAAAIMSDRRLKENIKQAGKTKHDLNLYEFNYIGLDDKRFRGVMADEVEKVMPDAIVKADDGYLAVDYDMLGIQMEEV
jgi:hypothetical protein